ncbi:MAG: RNA polymerase sigma factor RpoH [Succinivibrionaceae bacterium]|nr:RNA polymerase sigma factor RpoH [Succinivibrionaceae bacterium]
MNYNNSDAYMLVPGDNIDGYIRAINSIPLLTEKEEVELATRLKESGDLEAARKLVMSHLRFVVSIARGYEGYGLPLADLISEGTVGLMKAVKRFDVTQGVRLAAFAVHWIKAEIHEYVVKNWRLVKVATTKAQRKLFFKLRQNKKKIGWFNADERKQVAEDLGVTENDVEEMESRLTAQDVAFDNTADEEDNQLVPANYLVDKGSNFEKAMEQSDDTRMTGLALNKVLGKLDDRSYYIIKRRWLDNDKATLQDLASELHVSLERVRQLEKAAMSKMKDMLANNGVGRELAVIY